MKIKKDFKYILFISILIFSILPHFSLAAEGINTVLILKEAIATWYYLIRTISIAVMLLALIFIGIKMATTTIASEKAFFQRMLFDWVAGMILVFGIHYIMIFILQLNETMLDMISKTADSIYEADPSEYGGIENQSKTNDDIEVSIFDTVRTRAYDPKLINGTTGMVMYAFLVYYAYKFTFIYFKRYLTVAVLTVAAPVVAVSYALNKVVSGKTKIFSNWLKEYFFNVILQTIHAIIYVTFVLSALKLSLNSISGMFLAFMLLNFMSKADKIFRTIFNIGGNGSLVDDIADKDVGKEMINNFKNLTSIYLGNKAIRQFGKWERKKLFYKPAQKAFGAVMAHRMNNSKDNQKYVKDDSGRETTFTEDDYTSFENNADMQAILANEAELDLVRYDLEKLKLKIKANKKKKKDLEKKIQTTNNSADKKIWEDELQKLSEEIAKDEEKEEELELESDAKEQKAQILLDKFGNSKFARQFAFKQKMKDVFDPRKYTEYDAEKGKYVGIRAKYKGRFIKDKDGNLVQISRKKLSMFERMLLEDELTVDSIGMRMKDNINASTVLGMTDEDKKILSADIKDIKNVVTGFFKGFLSIPMFIESPAIGLGLTASSASDFIDVFSAYTKKNHAEFSLPTDLANTEGLSVKDVKFIRKQMSKQLNTARDDYIVESITTKNKKFVKLLAKGSIIATGNIMGAKFIKGTQTRKHGGAGQKLTRTGGTGYAEREHVLKQFYKQDELNRKTERLVLSRNSQAMGLDIANREIESYNQSLEDRRKLFQEAALKSNTALNINGILVPTSDDATDEEKMSDILSAKLQQKNADKIFIVAAAGATIEEFAREIMYSKEQQEDVVGEFNGVQINAEDFSSEQEIIERLSSTLDNKIADGNSENANATLVDLDDKKVLVTDKMIENAILNAAANRKKSISEFTLEESSFKEITTQLETEIFKKEDVSVDKKDKLSKALEKRVELVKTKMVVSEATTDSFREIISERGITNAGDLSVSEVESRVSDKLEEWVKVKPNATASVLDNIAKQRQALDSSSVSDSKKLAQPAFGGKTIEEITSSAVQARHQALTNLNKKNAGSSISEETTKKLKESLEERHRKEFQEFLIDVTQEQDDKRLAELLASVPEEQAEAAYCVLDVQRYNLEANRVKQKGAKAKHLTFDMDSSGVLDSLNSMKSSAEIKTGDRRVENNYDSSVGEQDTRVKESDGVVDPSRESSRRSALNQSDLMTSRKRSGIITSKEINSGIDRPLRDLASLIDSIGKDR